jgi:UDP-glucose 4-epimerase
LDTVTLRYFNVYSPRQDPIFGYAGAITRFDTRPRFGETPVICGDGEQTRESAGGNR